ncbi:MAG: glycosyltransferase family 4 protein [Candidatus Hodarchaeota archaeon]
MKILHVHPTYTSIKGGVERHIEGLSKYQATRGHQIRILTTEKGHNFKYSNNQISVHRVHKLSSLFSTDSYDVIHVHGYRVPWANIFGLLQKLRKQKVVLTTHGIYPPRSRKDAFAKKLYDNVLGGVNVKLFDACIALTPETESALLELRAPQEKIWIIPNSIDTERFKKIVSPGLFHSQYNIPFDKKIILYVGRIDWNKGLDLSIRSFSNVLMDVPDAIMVLVGGDYGYSTCLKDLTNKLNISDKVFFVGEVSENALYSAYAATDVFLLTSVYEGLPTVVLEAMACGVPVIASNKGGTSHVIEHGKDGFLTEFGNVMDTARFITNLLRNQKLRSVIGNNGKELVEKKYSWAHNSLKVEEVYNFLNPR